MRREKNEMLGATIIINMIETRGLDNIGKDSVDVIFKIIENELKIDHDHLMFCLNQNFTLNRYNKKSGKLDDPSSPFTKSITNYFSKRCK